MEVNPDLRALIAPLILGGAAAAYLGGGVVGGSGVAGLLADAGGFLTRNWGRSLAGATAAGVAVAGVVIGVKALGHDPEVTADTDRVSTAGQPDVQVPGPAGDPAPPVSAVPSPASSEAPPTGPPQPEPTPTTGQPDQTEVSEDPVQDSTGKPDDDAIRDPGDQLTDVPGDESTDDPTRDPSQQPTGDPTDDPTAQPVDPAALEPSARPMVGGLIYDVTIRVNGLAAGEAGAVTVTLDRPALGIHLDPRCDLVNLGRRTCRLTGPGTIQLLVTPVPGAPTTLTAELSPGAHRGTVRLG